ncbi:unnamed protein product, partial [Rotaria magnacalcarata]
PKATGQDLLNTICNNIDLLERDYFGLEYLDSHRNVVCLIISGNNNMIFEYSLI